MTGGGGARMSADNVTHRESQAKPANSSVTGRPGAGASCAPQPSAQIGLAIPYRCRNERGGILRPHGGAYRPGGKARDGNGASGLAQHIAPILAHIARPAAGGVCCRIPTRSPELSGIEGRAGVFCGGVKENSRHDWAGIQAGPEDSVGFAGMPHHMHHTDPAQQITKSVHEQKRSYTLAFPEPRTKPPGPGWHRAQNSIAAPRRAPNGAAAADCPQSTARKPFPGVRPSGGAPVPRGLPPTLQILFLRPAAPAHPWPARSDAAPGGRPARSPAESRRRAGRGPIPAVLRSGRGRQAVTSPASAPSTRSCTTTVSCGRFGRHAQPSMKPCLKPSVQPTTAS